MVTVFLPLLRKLFSNAAQGLRRDAEIRCDVVLWNLLDESRIGLEERQIPLFCGGAQGIIDPSVRGNVVALEKQPEKAFHVGNGHEHFFSCFSFKHQDF